jgi:hypothetical protein
MHAAVAEDDETRMEWKPIARYATFATALSLIGISA